MAEPLTLDQFRRDVIGPLYARAADLYADLPDFRYRWIVARRELRELAHKVRDLRRDVRTVDVTLAAIAKTDDANLNALASTTLSLTIVGRERDSVVALVETLDRAVSERIQEANVYAGIALSVFSVALAIAAVLISYYAWRYPQAPATHPIPTAARPSSASPAIVSP